ncbi:MAG: hypothetical protein LBJ32_01905 [Oscillospiraceae bacterium]|jgi:hypothetical protein|nr:hypothetical protein [Oscillospiraceae bacterium]
MKTKIERVGVRNTRRHVDENKNEGLVIKMIRQKTMKKHGDLAMKIYGKQDTS